MSSTQLCNSLSDSKSNNNVHVNAASALVDAHVALPLKTQREGCFEPMTMGHLAHVLSIENAAYAYPWNQRNFTDSLQAGYHAQVLMLTEVAQNQAQNQAQTQAQAEIDSGCNPPAGNIATAQEPVPIGYFLAMKGVDEVHLLNIAVAPGYQRQGWSLVMLDALAQWARNQPGVQWLWLEVRPSNTRACAVYERYGFRLVGHRRDYYPTSTGSIKTVREDALVMSRRLV